MKKDEDLIRKFRLEESVRRLQMLSEYSFITKPNLSEDGDDPQTSEQVPGGDNGGQQSGGNNGDTQQPQGNGGNDVPEMPEKPDSNDGGGQQPAGGNDAPPMADGGGDESAVEGDSEGGEEPIEDVEMEPAPEEDEEDGDGTGPDDEIIDVDDLTNAQEAAEAKIDGVDEKLTTLIAVMNKAKSAIDASNAKIAQLQKEIEERNPTEQEKLNLRSQANAPYSQSPRQYWEEKAKEDPRYDVMFNNDVPTDKEQEEFVLRKSDLKGVNPKMMERSFDYSPTLGDYLGF